MISAASLQLPLSGNNPSTLPAYHAHCMQLAYQMALQAACIDEVPVGAVVWHKTQARVIAYAHNQTMHMQSLHAHAEYIAMMQACQYLHNYRLVDCEVFVTLEPCVMCTGAFMHARIAHAYYLLKDAKTGGIVSQASLLDLPCNHHTTATYYAQDENDGAAQGLSSAYLALLQCFFKKKRAAYAKLR